MNTITASTRGAGLDRLAQALDARLPFRTSGSLKGIRLEGGNVYTPRTGMLAGADLDAFRAAARAERLLFVVYSYATPIAWVTTDGVVHHVSQRFSVTTTKQQALVRRHL